MNVALNMLKDGYCHIIGSDAHNDARRNFCLKEAYHIVSLLDQNISNQLAYNSSCIFEPNQKMRNIKLEELNFFQKLKKKLSNT